MTVQNDPSGKGRRHYSRRRHSIFFPLLLVALGVFLFLNNLGYIQGNAMDILVRLWPLILIVGGLDSIFSGNGYVGAVVGITAGTLLLMWNLGYLNLVGVDGWAILRLWPILLVAWGLDIVIGRRGILSALVGIVLGLGLAAGGIWLVMNPQVVNQNAVTENISQGLDKAKLASLSMDLGVANLAVGAGASSTNLIEGTIYLQKDEKVIQDYALQGDRGVYRLENSDGTFTWMPLPHAPWKLELNSSIPVQLSINIGAGEQNLDLTKLQIDQLSLELGVGEINLTLPSKGNFRGNVHGAVGVMVIRVPRSTAVRFEIDKALTTLSYPAGYTLAGNTLTSPAVGSSTQTIDLRIGQPVGSIFIREIP